MDRDALIREVADCFDDDGALLVLADRLQLAGDPRGELIASQTIPGKVSQKRMRELERAVGSSWLGPLATIVDAAKVRYRRGVPSRLVLQRTASELALTDPLWSLPETVDLARCAHPKLPQLLARLERAHRLEGALPAVVVELRGNRRPPRLRSLGCHLGAGRTAAGLYVTRGLLPEAVATVGEDPELRELRHGDNFEASDYRWVWASALGAHLELLSAPNRNNRLVRGELAVRQWLDELTHARPALRACLLTENDDGTFEPYNWTVRFTRDTHGAFTVMQASLARGVAFSMKPLLRLAGGLATVDRGQVSALTLDAAMAKQPGFSELEREVARLGCTLELS